MKNLVLIITVALFSFQVNAQSADTVQLGKIVYYEGKVELGTGASWAKPKINMPVRKGQHIRTTGDAMAEIVWSNGIKSVVGPGSNIGVQALYASSSKSPKVETEGIFTNVKNKAGNEQKRSEVGGIRRSETESGPKNEDNQNIYWKEDKEIVFEEAYTIYEGKDYAKAIAALQAFIHQKPRDPMAKYASFALGHCYIMENNPIKAKEIFEQFLVQYPNDPLKQDAQLLIGKL